MGLNIYEIYRYFPINTSLVPLLLPMHADGEEHGYEVN